MDNYHLDLKKYSLKEFKNELETSDLIPSRQILQENLETTYLTLENQGIDNLQDLLDNLKNSRKLKEFSKKSGLSEEYLKILRRELKSYQPTPIALERYPGVSMETIEKLKDQGIKNSRELYRAGLKSKPRQQLALELDFDLDDLVELVRMADLSRVKWVGPIFSRMFLEAGIGSAQELGQQDPKVLYPRLVDINQHHEYTRASFVENDILLSINFAKKLTSGPEF